MDVFDSYFRRADLDQDGRISGQEAVAFCQGSNLPKPVLAQIWMHADQKRTGFLGRPEFYNFLKLVTVAQSGRQLTPDIVKAALHGPAAAKIPAPQINPVPPPAAQINSLATPTPRLNSIVPPSSQMGVPVQNLGFRTPQTNPSAPQFNHVSSPADQTNPSATPTSQLNSMVPPSSQMGTVAPTQNPGFRAPQANPSMGTNQQFFSSSNNQFMRPPGPTSTPLATPGNMASVHLPGTNTPNLLTDWLGGRTTGAPGLGTATIGTITSSVPSKPLDQGSSSSQATANNSKALVTTGNGFSSDSVFGGDVFTLTSQSKPSDSSGISPVTAGSQNSVKVGPLDSLQNPSMLTQGGVQLQWSQPVVKQNQLDAVQNKSAIATSNVSVGPGIPASSQSQITWPRITPSDVQKYTAVFVEVDKDRDGKISGEQARNLFLSWRLPREVLKQVWDLSDQDNDSMLSLREFCTALYLMERYREGRPLPTVLPNTMQFDETLLHATSQPSTAYSGPAWQANPGVSQQVPGSRPPLPVTGIRPTAQYPIQNDGSGRLVQQNSRIVVPEKHLVNQVSNEQTATNSKFQETIDAEKNELEILGYKEKVEFYRTKMQELVLYKSRCDNRLNEITERASADKREAESLGKKYEEKYKQVGEIASKLTVEEATYRDIQERKLELQNAIVKMEQGGSADGLLQVRADRIQSDLEELLKALGERCKQHGVHIKSTAMVELPFGWQPGIQEGAANWDEDWDKFEDDGFSLAKELTVDTDNDVSSIKPKHPSAWSDKDSTDEFSPASNIAGKGEKPFSISERIIEDESAFDQSEADSARSASESPSRDFHSSQFGMHDFSPSAKTSHSDHGGAESTNSGDKFVDDPSWASAFDVNDDVDSVWGFKPTNTKDSGYERGKPDSFFDSGEFGLNPIKVDSPGARSVFGNEKKSSVFADSVPSTPFGSGLSPNFNEDRSFNNFSRFDSFSTHDGGLFPQRESQFSRFDSMRSTATDFDRGQGERQFSRFDSIMSTATDFDRGQGESQFARFDSIRSTTTTDFDRIRGFPSFDDSDPFGSTGPFKPSEGHSPRRGSDKWSAF